MKQKDKPSILNYILPLIMIALGVRHYLRHGVDLVTIVPIILGVFAFYLVLFNFLLLQRLEVLILKIWRPIGQFITIILLTVTFYAVFAPVGIFLRLFKKDILDRNFKVDRLSYWVDKPKKQQTDYAQQF